MSPAPLPRASHLPAICEAGRKALVCCPVDAMAWPTRIAATNDEEHVIVFAPLTGQGPVRRFPGALITLEIATEQALYRLPATLLEEISGSTPMWKLGDLRPVERVQRRNAHRFRGYFEAALAAKPLGTAPITLPLPQGKPRNLSTTGCYLQTPVPISLGTPVQIDLQLAPRHVWTLEGEVVRIDSHQPDLHGLGIKFIAPDREAQLAIARFITAAERRPQHLPLIA